MTLVNHETGEIVETIGRDAARRLTTEAQTEFQSSRDHFEQGWAKIELAVAGGGHIDLGYRSPGDYLHSEFDGVLSGLDIPSRRIAVKTMTEWGLSTRAIAPVIGVSHKTVVQDSHVVPEVPPAEATEAEEVAPPVGLSIAPGSADVQPAPDQGVAPPAPRPLVTGIDGKQYSRPTPAPKPPVLEGEAAEYANAEKSCLNLNRAIRKLLEFQHSNMREGMRRYWSMASIEVPPVQRADVTPEQMRVAAHGLLALADEWD